MLTWDPPRAQPPQISQPEWQLLGQPQPSPQPRQVAISPTQQAAAPAEPPRTTEPVQAQRAAIDFGGQKAGRPLSLFEQAGGNQSSSFWSTFIPASFAAAPPSPSCSGLAANQPGGEAVTPGDPPTHDTAEFLPGLNDVPWGGMVHGTFVVLSSMAVLRRHTLPVNNPTLEIYPDWSAVTDKAHAEPVYRLPTSVRTYQARDGFLYRIFVQAPRSPIRCIDLLIPYEGGKAVDGRLHYQRGTNEYVAVFKPSRLEL